METLDLAERLRGLRTPLLAAVVLGCFAATAGAASIGIGVSTSSCGTQSVSTSSNFLALSVGYANGSHGSCNSGTDMQVQIEATLTSVKIFASATNPLPYPDDFPASAFGGANLLDTLIITGGSGIGTLIMDIGVTGTLSASGIFVSVFEVIAPLVPVPNWNPVGLWYACGSYTSGYTCPATTWGESTSVNGIVSLSIPFVFGVPFNTQLHIDGGTGAGGYWSEGGSGTVDFFNTAQILPLLILDSNGNQVLGATATSDSGFSYDIASANGAQVPDPGSTLLLLGIGLAGLGAWRKRWQ